MRKIILAMIFINAFSFGIGNGKPRTQSFLTPLHKIISESKTDSDQDAHEVAILLAAGADATAVTPKSLLTPLHRAAYLGREKIVKLLLPYYNKNTINSRAQKGETPLVLASIESLIGFPQMGIVTLLLNAGADPKIPNQYGESPIERAIRINKYNTEWPGRKPYLQLEKLLTDYADISPESIIHPTIETLEKAIKIGALSLVTQLITRLSLTKEQLNALGQLARTRFEETKDPVYKEIGRLLLEEVKKVYMLTKVEQEGAPAPHDITTTIVNMSKSPSDSISKGAN